MNGPAVFLERRMIYDSSVVRNHRWLSMKSEVIPWEIMIIDETPIRGNAG